jgi:alpha-L-arabinofuranosidase
MNRIKIVLLYTSSLLGLTAHAEKTTVTGHVNARKPISPDLVGIFFEDLNSAADGRLYAEWVQNRSFEYQATEQRNMGSLTYWEYFQRGGGAVFVRTGMSSI